MSPSARARHRATLAAPLPAAVPRMALVAAVAVYFQMVLGGLVRHSGAALACTDIPLCRGSLWPDAHPTVLVQALHRLTAVAVAVLVFVSSTVTLSPRRPAPRSARAGGRSRPCWSACRSRSASTPSPASWPSPRWRRTWWSRPRCWRRSCSSRCAPIARGGPGRVRARLVPEHGEPVQAAHHRPGRDHVHGRAVAGARRHRPLARRS